MTVFSVKQKVSPSVRCRSVGGNHLSGTVPSELGLLTRMTGSLCVACTFTQSPSCEFFSRRVRSLILQACMCEGVAHAHNLLTKGLCVCPGRELYENSLLSGTIATELALLTALSSLCVAALSPATLHCPQKPCV